MTSPTQSHQRASPNRLDIPGTPRIQTLKFHLMVKSYPRRRA